MLRKLSPVISGQLLTALNDVPAGGWIAITSRTLPPQPRLVPTGASIEDLAEALFESVPVSDRAAAPLVGWLADADDDAALDAFFTVQGAARDAERRVLEMGRLTELPENPWHDASAIITVDSSVDFAFFVCVGQGEHAAAPLFTAARRLAA
ncbi:hypothetical protein [Leifsonia sp. SIMBA_070]|uniref:hypothetical protein n=1 Tax=Leifsonia sp. SIMBA_070 TaxID=3085810 RepID=UPI003979E953